MCVKSVGDVRVTHAEATKIVEKNLTREFAKGGWRFHRCVLVSTQLQVPIVQAGQKAVEVSQVQFRS